MTMQGYHGWGFPSVRAPPFDTFDRGYFGNPNIGKASKIIITYSFGLHLVPKEYFKTCEEMVILSGFISLKEQRAALKIMRLVLSKDPVALLKAFYLKAGYNGKAPWLESEINVPLLSEDLLRMEEAFDVSLLLDIPKISIWSAKEDQILSGDKGLELKANLPQAVYREFEGGHLAPLEKWIAEQTLKGPFPEEA